MKLLWAVPIVFLILELSLFFSSKERVERQQYAVQYIRAVPPEITLDQAWLMASESIREFNRVQP